jgi:prolyl oligopeptidase PreP (S9A serine peptidase family)
VEAVAIALIVAVAAIIGPLLIARQNSRRLDALAKVTATTLEKVKTVEIHTDGTLTAAFRAELAAVEAQVVAMRRPTPDTQAAIRATEKRLEVMRRNLEDREASTAAAQQLIANGPDGADGDQP